MRDRFIDESIEEITNRESMERFANARIPSAKAIPDVKGSRQEGEIRNTRNYRLRVRARRECSPFVPVEGERPARDGQKGAGRRTLIY